MSAPCPPSSRQNAAVGSSGAPLRSASVAGPAGIVVGSPKKSTATPSPAEVAVTHQAHDVPAGQRAEHAPARVRTERDDVHAEGLTGGHEPVEQLRRLDRLGDDREAGGARTSRQPRAGDVPVPEVRQREDHPAARRDRRIQVARPRRSSNVRCELLPLPGPQTEHLVPVARRSWRTRSRSRGRARHPPASPSVTRRRCRATWRRRRGQATQHARAAPRASGPPSGAGRRRASLSAGPVREIGDAARRARWVRKARRRGGGRSPRSGVAWRQTITKRWTAVKAVSASITQSTGTRMSNASPTPSSTIRSRRSMSPPRASRAERLGLGALVGHEHREREHGKHEDRQAAASSSARCHATPPRITASATRSAHGVEERAAVAGGAALARHRAVEHVGQPAEHEPEHREHEVAVGDQDRGADRRGEPERAVSASAETPEPVQRPADRLEALLGLGPPASVEHAARSFRGASPTAAVTSAQQVMSSRQRAGRIPRRGYQGRASAAARVRPARGRPVDSPRTARAAVRTSEGVAA